MRFFKYLDIKYDQLTNQINDYLRDIFGKSNESFSNASPFGQILNVQKEFYQQNILYQKSVVRNFFIGEADNDKVIKNLSRIGGHNPTRAISATGTIMLKLKTSVDIFEDVAGGIIKIKDKTQIKNESNGLIYSLNIGQDEQIYELGQNKDIYLNIIQGTYETYEFTGDGTMNQSFSVNTKAANTIDNFEIEIKYNNETISIKDGLFDMQRLEKSCYTRTGMNGGLDVYFGNGSFGFIPLQGSRITVTYLLTDGTDGIILSPQINEFDWIDEPTDIENQPVDMDDVFDIHVDKQIGFASNGETPEFTKAIMPYISRNMVLATPSQYIYHLKRLNLFSKINVYNTLNDNDFKDNNLIYLFLVPNVRSFFNTDVNYFNLPLDAFYLDDYEKEKTITYLRKMANISVGTEIEIIQPTIIKYIINIYIRKFRGYTDDTIKQSIITNVSEYLSTYERDDRIPKSDLISLIEVIDGVDSVNVSFTSKKNEDYHKLKPDSNLTYGIDTALGDIVVEPKELAIIRGGWSDRNYTYYNDSIDSDGLSSMNIMFVGITDENINNEK